MAAHLTGAQIGNTTSPLIIGFLLAGSTGDKIFAYTTMTGLTLLWIAALLTLYTGYDYLLAAMRHAMTEEE